MFYLYECKKCKKQEEISRGMNEEKEVLCPKCNTEMFQVITGGCGTIFNGVGWASKNTATAPRAKHYKVKELVGPKFLKKAIRNR